MRAIQNVRYLALVPFPDVLTSLPQTSAAAVVPIPKLSVLRTAGLLLLFQRKHERLDRQFLRPLWVVTRESHCPVELASWQLFLEKPQYAKDARLGAGIRLPARHASSPS